MLGLEPMSNVNLDLVKAFPAALRDDALRLVSELPEPPFTAHSFSLKVGQDTVWIPYRIYHDPAQIDSTSLSSTQRELLGCLLTRHHSGFVRAKHLSEIIDSNHEWIPPFVVQLVGEYVIEIISSIRDSLNRLDPRTYREFLSRNSAFYETTKRRVQSYWDCYHRGERKEDYAAFQILELFDGLNTETVD